MPRITLLKSFGMLGAGLAIALGLQIARSRASASAGSQVCANTNKPPQARIPTGLATADLRSPSYDPVDLVARKVAPGYQLFGREPVSEPWARQMEEQLGQMLRQSLGTHPDARIERLECRQSACRMVLSVDKRQGKEATLAVQHPPIAPAFVLGQSRIDGQRFHQEGFFFFGPGSREVTAHARWQDQMVRQWLARQEH